MRRELTNNMTPMIKTQTELDRIHHNAVHPIPRMRCFIKWMVWPWLGLVLLSTLAWGAPLKKAVNKKTTKPAAKTKTTGKPVGKTLITLTSVGKIDQRSVEFVLLDKEGREVAVLQNSVTQKVPVGSYKVSARKTRTNQEAMMFEVIDPSWIQVKKEKKPHVFLIQIQTIPLSVVPETVAQQPETTAIPSKTHSSKVTLMATGIPDPQSLLFVLSDTTGKEVASLQSGTAQGIPPGTYNISARPSAASRGTVVFSVKSPRFVEIQDRQHVFVVQTQATLLPVVVLPPKEGPTVQPSQAIPGPPFLPTVEEKRPWRCGTPDLEYYYDSPLPVCSWCAEPHLPARSTTLDVASGYPWLFQARALASVWTNARSAMSVGGGIRVGLHEFLADVLLVPHVYRSSLFSLAIPLSGSLGAAYDQSPFAVKEPAFEGAFSAGILGTFHPTQRLFLSMHAAFEYKRISNIPVFYAIQDGPEPTMTVAYRSPDSFGLLLEPTIEVSVHRRLNLFVRGGYTFRWDPQNRDYALPQNLLSNWHVNAGATLVF